MSCSSGMAGRSSPSEKTPQPQRATSKEQIAEEFRLMTKESEQSRSKLTSTQ